MISLELESFLSILMATKRPEDVFGELIGTIDEQLQRGRHLYRKYSRLCHPDKNNGASEASQASALLNVFWDQAQEAIIDGSYGLTKPKPIGTISSKKNTYEVLESIPASEVANLFLARTDTSDHVLLKVLRLPVDADLMDSEIKALKVLSRPDDPRGKSFLDYFPKPLESFRFRDTGTGVVQRANAFAGNDGMYSLSDVLKAYPKGIDPKDMAWMFRRLLDALGYAHDLKVIHGAVLPTHVLIHPNQHHLMLVDWYYSLLLCDVPESTQHIKAISPGYRSWYPPEVLAKKTPMPGTDILMAARCMVAIMGGDPITGQLPASVPRRIQGFLKSCLLVPQNQRPQRAWKLRQEFTELIEQLWGERKFRPFNMPKQKRPSSANHHK
jgi:serine/threonine protein kinase